MNSFETVNPRRLIEERFMAERVFANFASHLERVASEGKKNSHTVMSHKSCVNDK